MNYLITTRRVTIFLQVETLQREVNGAVDFGGVDKVMSEPLQMKTQHFRKLGQLYMHPAVCVPGASRIE